IYLLARRFARTAIALIVAGAYAADPLVWVYSEVAYPYTLLAFLSVVLAATFWQARGVLIPSLLFGALAGFRQDLLPLLGPLWLWTFFRPQALRERPWRERSIATLALAAGALVWLIPTTLLSGGLVAYVETVLRQTGSIGETYSVPAHGLDALWANFHFTAQALGWGLFALAPLTSLLAGARLVGWMRAARPLRALGPTQAFFLVWIGPALAFYVVVHIGEWGYVLSVLPGLYVLVAAGAERLVRATPPALVSWWRAAAIAVVLVPAMLFVGGADRFSAAALARHDDALAARTTYVRDHFAPETTIVLAREDYLLVRYYLPEYRAWLYDPQPYQKLAAKRKRAMRSTAIVIFTEGLRPQRQLDVRTVEVAPGIDIAYAPIEPGTVLEFYGERYIVREGP
ncbi:MAG: hypothetical protein AAB114_03500, partial [Chloroflexota bacterium]